MNDTERKDLHRQLSSNNPRDLYTTNAADLTDHTIASDLPRIARECADQNDPYVFAISEPTVRLVRDMVKEIQLRLQEQPGNDRQKLFAPVLAALKSEMVTAHPANEVFLAQALVTAYRDPPAYNLTEKFPPALNL